MNMGTYVSGCDIFPLEPRYLSGPPWAVPKRLQRGPIEMAPDCLLVGQLMSALLGRSRRGAHLVDEI
jgi:hypothetical protein